MNKIIDKFFTRLSIFMVIGLLISCSDDDKLEGDTINQRDFSIAAYLDAGDNTSASSYNTLYRALDKAGLLSDLDGSGSFTLFAPTDDAFAAAGIDVDNTDAADLAVILNYHLLSDTVSSPSGRLTTVEGNTLGAYNGVINGIATFDLQFGLTNGLLFQIDAVLTPPAGNLNAVINGNSDLTLATSALAKAGIGLGGSSNRTFFLPNDEAMTDAGLDAAGIAATDATVLEAIFNYHIAPGDFFSSALADGRYETAAGTLVDHPGLEIVTGDPIEINGGVEVTVGNIPASNGVVHVIDAVLSVPTTVLDGLGPAVDISLGNDAVVFDGLYGGIVRAGLDATIFADLTSVYSVAGPCCGAFNEANYPDDDDLLAAIQAHIFAGYFDPYTAAVAGGTRFESIGGDKYVATSSSNGAFINNTWFNAFGPTSTSAINTLYDGKTFSTFGGGVLTGLPETSLLDSLNQPKFRTFYEAINLIAPDLDDSDYTILAMDTMAFRLAYGYKTRAEVKAADPSEFESLLNHIIPGWYFGVDLDDGTPPVLTTSGSDLQLAYVGGDLHVVISISDVDSYVEITLDDIMTANGVIHSVATPVEPE